MQRRKPFALPWFYCAAGKEQFTTEALRHGENHTISKPPIDLRLRFGL